MMLNEGIEPSPDDYKTQVQPFKTAYLCKKLFELFTTIA